MLFSHPTSKLKQAVDLYFLAKRQCQRSSEARSDMFRVLTDVTRGQEKDEKANARSRTETGRAVDMPLPLTPITPGGLH